MKISRNSLIKIGAIAVASPFFVFVLIIGDKILLNFLNKNINVARQDLERLFEYPVKKISSKNVGKFISEGSLLTEATKRLSHHDDIQDDYKVKGDGKKIIWIFGDSWLNGIRKTNKNKNIIGNKLNGDYESIRFIGTGSWSPLLIQLAYRDRISRYKEIPDSVVIFLDQTDIGDDFCRYRPSVIRDANGNLLGVLNNDLNVNGIYRRWGFHLAMRKHKSGIILATQRLIHALHLRMIPSINGLTDCTENELIAWQKGIKRSPSGVNTNLYEKYFLFSIGDLINIIRSNNKSKKILLVTHDWARHSLSEGHKDYLPKNISSIVESISKEKEIYHLHVKTADYKDQNISNIYRYPLDRFSHLKDYSYLSKRIGNSLKNIFLIEK